MKNKPRIFAGCKAGCLWETVHKSDFQSLAVSIDTSEWTNSGSGFVCNLPVDNLIDEDVVLLDAPYELYANYGLDVTQSGDTITFTCSVKPSSDVEIKLAIISAMRAVKE